MRLWITRFLLQRRKVAGIAPLAAEYDSKPASFRPYFIQLSRSRRVMQKPHKTYAFALSCAARKGKLCAVAAKDLPSVLT
jgi:hypothetical protein